MSAPYRRPRRPAPSIPGRVAVAPLTYCTCGKAAHRSRKAAKVFARQHHPAGGLSPYLCPHSDPDAVEVWHLGHLPAPVVDGRVDRAYARQAKRPAGDARIA